MKLPESYKEERKQIIDKEGAKYPGRALVKMELEPGYEWDKTRVFPYIKVINEAHLVMLCEQGIITRDDGKCILKALEGIRQEDYRNCCYNGKFEDLYFEMEDRLIHETDGAAGNMHLARSRNDMCLTWAHMSVRDDVIQAMEKLIRLQNTMFLFAKEHKDTLYVVHTHTQHAQPSVLGHYFLGASYVLGRDVKRLKRAYESVNSSPMGAAAITTTGFPINRQRVAELSGFDCVIENAYDAIGNIDYMTDTATAVGLSCLNMGRFITDMILWATEEMKMIRVADGYISTSSIMPQKRNPIALEHLRSSLSVTKGLADAVVAGFLKSPYGDISDREDIEGTMHLCLESFCKNMDLFEAVMATLEVDKELLEKRAYESFSVVTDIADQLYRFYHIPFRKAHSFVSTMVKKADRQNYNLKNISREFFAETYEEFFGEMFEQDFQPVLDSIDPWHFVRVREVYGGTGPKAMENMIQSAHKEVMENSQCLEGIKRALADSEQKRKEAVSGLIT